MVSVRKSPNIMSTTGRNPVIAAPTPIPVNPASEMGVSRTRSDPNSSTRPDNTLNGVPASATSSRMACANVNSRTEVSSIDVLVHFVQRRIGRSNGKVDSGLHLGTHFFFNSFQRVRIRDPLLDQKRAMVLNRIALSLPFLLFRLGAVILTIDVPNVVASVSVRIAHQKRRALAPPRAAYQPGGSFVNRAHVLPINVFRVHSKSSSARQNISSSGFRIMRIFRI